MAVATRIEAISRVISVNQVDTTGDRLDAVNRIDQFNATSPGVACVQAKTDIMTIQSSPELVDGLEPACHCSIPAGCVFDQDRNLLV